MAAFDPFLPLEVPAAFNHFAPEWVETLIAVDFYLAIDMERHCGRFAFVDTLIIAAGTALGVLLFDWVGTGRVAGYDSTFDYRYWPPTRLRIASLVLLWVATTVSLTLGHAGPNAAVWPVFVVTPAMVVWGVVVAIDFKAQRKTGYRRPGRYSDPEDR